MHLSVIIPAYNEEKNIEKTIDFCHQYLKTQNYNFEIIIVNDGSGDKTKDILKELKNKMNNLRFINIEHNMGKGEAVRQGLLAGNGNFLLFLDADNSTSIHYVEKTWSYFDKGFDVVIGSRNKKDAMGAKQLKPQIFWKRFLGICGNFLIRKITVKNIRDTQCGFKVMTKKFVEDILPKTKTKRWALDVEILFLAQLLNYKIAAIPIQWINCPNSRVGLGGYFQTLKEVVKIKFDFITRQYKI